MAGIANPEVSNAVEHGKWRNLRWWVCGLLFFATTVNYMDRQVLGILKPVLERELNWRESDYGWVVFGFQLAYALMMPVAGRLIDWLGTRLGYTVAVLVWSLASMSHSLARTPLQFSLARFALGIGESANFPAAVKTVADWFPKRERALATGIFNSGTNVGALVAPLLVPVVAAALGWRWAFLITGSLDLVWIVVWLLFYREPREHKLLSKAELAVIESDHTGDEAKRVPYSKMLSKRAAWALLLSKFITDPVWWFYLFWLPGFLNKTYGLDLTKLGPPLVAIYLAADVGSVGGGWLSSSLIKRGWSVNNARKTTLVLCALSITPVASIMFVGNNLWLVVGLISLACAAHQGWSANIFTLASDLFPKSAVGSAVGLAGLGGAVGGMLVAPAIGRWLDFSHGSYGPLFFIAGFAYLVSFTIVHLLIPKIEPVDL